jgi:DNA invertase Pin-like site-specific DNA recombinase
MNGIIYTRIKNIHNSKQMKILEFQKKWAFDVLEEFNIKLIEPLIVEEGSARLPRPEFNRLIELIDSRGLLCLITWDLSRLSRNSFFCISIPK